MKLPTILHESVPITKNDCLIVFNRVQKKFDFPIHFHNEYEINFLLNAAGATRIIGDHTSLIPNTELVMVGPNLKHGWSSELLLPDVSEITIQFHRDLLPMQVLDKTIFKSIQRLLISASQGVAFTQAITQEALPILHAITKAKRVQSYILLIQLLEILSKEAAYTVLNSTNVNYLDEKNILIEKMYMYVEQNFAKKITLEEMASFLHMTSISFSRLIKQKTGKTFINFLNDYRINYACRLLQDTSKTVAEIAYNCGFNNQANFNRIFKEKIKISPSDYKKQTLEALAIK